MPTGYAGATVLTSVIVGARGSDFQQAGRLGKALNLSQFTPLWRTQAQHSWSRAPSSSPSGTSRSIMATCQSASSEEAPPSFRDTEALNSLMLAVQPGTGSLASLIPGRLQKGHHDSWLLEAPCELKSEKPLALSWLTASPIMVICFKDSSKLFLHFPPVQNTKGADCLEHSVCKGQHDCFHGILNYIPFSSSELSFSSNNRHSFCRITGTLMFVFWFFPLSKINVMLISCRKAGNSGEAETQVPWGRTAGRAHPLRPVLAGRSAS